LSSLVSARIGPAVLVNGMRHLYGSADRRLNLRSTLDVRQSKPAKQRIFRNTY